MKYYAESDQNQNVASAPQDYLFKANGQFQDLKEFATQDQITELQNTKVDKGSSTSIIFEALDGTKYPLVLILDPEIVQVISPNGNNVIVAYRAGYIEFMEEMLRINTSGDESHEEPYITIGKDVSTSGNTEYVESVFDETSETYNELDFSSSISSAKMSGIGITNYPVKVNFNTFVVTYKNGETLDLSQYFLSDEE